MRLIIEYTLDLSDGFELNALLGTIVLGDGTSFIREDATYLDSWFSALQAGLKRLLRGQKEVSIDLVDEPSPLFFSVRPDKLIISYQNNKVFVATVAAYKEVLEEAIALFSAEIEHLAGKFYGLPVWD